MEGFHEAIITNSADPESRGRVRVKIPHILGNVETGWVSSIFAGSIVPSEGSRVWVTSESGNSERLLFLDPQGGGRGADSATVALLLNRIESLERWSRGEVRTSAPRWVNARIRSEEPTLISHGSGIFPNTPEFVVSTPGDVRLVNEESTLTPSPARFKVDAGESTIFGDAKLTSSEPARFHVSASEAEANYPWSPWVEVRLHPKPPPIVAHRSRSLGDPENTIEALHLLEPWVSGVEFDVRMTSDGVPVLMHDASVNRTTNGTGLVSSYTLQQIQQLNVQGTNAKVPSLADFLAAVKAREDNLQGRTPFEYLLVDIIGSTGPDTERVAETLAVVNASGLRHLCIFVFRFLVSIEGAQTLRNMDPVIPIGTFSANSTTVHTQIDNSEQVGGSMVLMGSIYASSGDYIADTLLAAGIRAAVTTGEPEPASTGESTHGDDRLTLLLYDKANELDWWHDEST